MSNSALNYSIRYLAFDENYRPASNTRLTTNFANLARGAQRKQNLLTALNMINQRFNSLVTWDNPNSDRFSVEIEIVSVDLNIESSDETFPSIEVLKTHIVDNLRQQKIEGVVGNNFSSYIRDYDFSVLLAQHNKEQSTFQLPEHFGELHGQLFKHFVQSDAYHQHFAKLPIICISVSDNKVYERNANQHPILGVEYVPTEPSLTELYFQKMGLQVRYFMPKQSVAPLAFYFFGDLLNDYTNLELASTISTMETFQKIYRPEIYNALSPAEARYIPRLTSNEYKPTSVVYDRDERSSLALRQGQYVQQHLIKPYQHSLAKWVAQTEYSK
jgi:hypothetical protein